MDIFWMIFVSLSRLLWRIWCDLLSMLIMRFWYFHCYWDTDSSPFTNTLTYSSTLSQSFNLSFGHSSLKQATNTLIKAQLWSPETETTMYHSPAIAEQIFTFMHLIPTSNFKFTCYLTSLHTYSEWKPENLPKATEQKSENIWPVTCDIDTDG